MEEIYELIELFETVNEIFINNDRYLLDKEVNERCICGALAMELYDYIKHNDTKYKDYNVDVEYNRNVKDKKQMNGNNIIPDLIMHKRKTDENLIVLEMKKDTRPKSEIESDIKRIQTMCDKTIINRYKYKLGIFYLLKSDNNPNVFYYIDGKWFDDELNPLDDIYQFIFQHKIMMIL